MKKDCEESNEYSHSQANNELFSKSLLALDIATRVSSGQEMPEGSPDIAGGAGVVLIAPLDGLADTIYPRLQRVGADLSREEEDLSQSSQSSQTVDNE